MKKKFTENEIRALEKQLSCPEGELGLEVGENMNKSNIQMTLSTMEFLEVRNGCSVLELGHGNCGHLDSFFELASNIDFYGLEVSKTMFNEAKAANEGKRAKFLLYDGVVIPYKDHSFDRIMSVNTVYFWSKPQKLINEIERVLKPNGICVLTYADKDFMRTLPFVGDRFKLFDRGEVESLIQNSNLRITDMQDKLEAVKSKMGTEVERKYTMVKLKRSI